MNGGDTRQECLNALEVAEWALQQYVFHARGLPVGEGQPWSVQDGAHADEQYSVVHEALAELINFHVQRLPGAESEEPGGQEEKAPD